MGLELKSLLLELEASRSQGMDCSKTVAMTAVRKLDIPLDLLACRELRVMAQVFNADQAELAGAILRAALMDMQEHLDDDLDVLAETARALMNDPCQQASEAI